MAVHITWNGKEFEDYLRKATVKGLQRATVFLHAECRRAVSKPNSGVKVRFKDQSKEAKDQRKAAGRNKTSRTVYPSPSKPGEPPKLRTGFGQRNIVMEFDKEAMAGRVGVTANGMYMFYLEVGTRRIERRPWLLSTLLEHAETIGKLAATGGDG